MKSRKKINPVLYQHLALGLIVLVFVYWFYYLYGVYRDYRAEREINTGNKTFAAVAAAENQNADENLPVTPPSFYIIPPDTPDGNAALDIFRIHVNKNDGTDTTGEEKNKPSDFTILGTVKQDQLYLAVRTQADNKIRLIPQGATINNNYRIKKLEPFSVIINDSEGLSHTYKIFQWQEIKEIPYDEKK